MNKKIIVIASFVLAACGDSSPVAVTSAPRFAQSGFNVKTPFSGVVVNPCNGETVVLTGYLHDMFSTDVDADGGTTVRVHANPQGISGVGSFGNSYNATGATNASLKIDPNTGMSEKFINVFNLIGSGTAPNFKVRENVHIIIDANGEPKLVRSTFDVSCN